MKEIDKNSKTFEDIKHIDENGIEFWYAREIMEVLQYSKWQNFEKIIDKAKTSCKNSDISAFEHFTDVSKTIKMPKGAEKTILDYKLTRYACYLIAQNGDSRKRVIALAQTYFAVQTRKQEISEKEYSMLTEQKLKKDNVQTEKEVNKTHYNIGKNIREVIAKNGGTMSEELPTPKKSLKQLEKENKKMLNK